MIFNVDFCRFRVPYFQTCAPYFVWGVGFSLDRVLALGICQSQGWIQYWNLSIHQSSSVWMGSQARLSCGNSEMMGLGHQNHQISEVQLEILIASIVNLARYCLIWIETWELLFQLEERSLAQCFLDHYLIRARAVYKTSCFIVIAYIHCIHPITPPLSLALSLQVAPYSGWWFEICLPLFCTSLQHFATCCKHDAGWWWWWWWKSPMTSIIVRGLKHYPSVALGVLGGTGSLPEVRPEIVLCRGRCAES